MNRDDIIAKVKGLNWPAGSYVVFGSGPLAAVGLRLAQDIDFLVSPALHTQLKTEGWRQIEKSPNDKPVVFEDFEAHDNWNFSYYAPTLEHLLATADVIEGVPFASLEEVRKWKDGSGRPKDAKDVMLIDNYLAKQQR